MLSQFVRFIFMATAGLALFCMPASAASCEGLASLELQGGKITSASLVAAGEFMPPGGGGPMMGGPGGPAAFKNTPAFCRVTATLTPTADSDIKIEVWMPAENWNGKLVGTGNGVWAGSIGYSALAEPLARGYATVATDTGHVGRGPLRRRRSRSNGYAFRNRPMGGNGGSAGPYHRPKSRKSKADDAPALSLSPSRQIQRFGERG